MMISSPWPWNVQSKTPLGLKLLLFLRERKKATSLCNDWCSVQLADCDANRNVVNVMFLHAVTCLSVLNYVCYINIQHVDFVLSFSFMVTELCLLVTDFIPKFTLTVASLKMENCIALLY